MLKSALVAVGAFALSGCMPPLPGSPGAQSPQEPLAGGSGACGSGTWQPGWLEVHHIDAGQAIATLIVSPTGRSMLIDAGETEWDRSDGAVRIGDYLGAVLGCRRLDYAVISHFHLDHAGVPGYGGLWHLVVEQGYSIGKLLHRDLSRFVGTGGAVLAAWRSFLQAPEGLALSPEIASIGRGQVQLGAGVDFAFVAVDGSGLLPAGDFSSDPAPPDENDYSVAALLRFGRLDYLTAGDLSGRTLVSAQNGYSYHDGETAVAAVVRDVDVYRVSHHGSAHASNRTLLAELEPEVSIVQVGDGNRNGHPAQDTVDRLVAMSAVYFTERGDPDASLGNARVVGDIVLRSADGIDYTVAGDAFVASDPRRIDADGDGYFEEADPDDDAAWAVPPRNGGCDGRYQVCP
jgi:hypothetical protein